VTEETEEIEEAEPDQQPQEKERNSPKENKWTKPLPVKSLKLQKSERLIQFYVNGMNHFWDLNDYLWVIICDQLSDEYIGYSYTNSNESEWGCLVRYYIQQSYLF
jgi:hypothetical protein